MPDSTNGSEWTIAIPLIAAVVGALGAFVNNLRLKKRDEKRERQALARLVDDDLARIESALKAAIAKSESGTPPDLRYASFLVQEVRSQQIWTETRLDLARYLSFEEWDVLRDTYTVIDVAWYDIEPAEALETTDDDIDPVDILIAYNAESFAPRLLKVIPGARRVCQAYLGGAPPAKVPLAD